MYFHPSFIIPLKITLRGRFGRAKELRTLQLFDESVEGRTFQFDWRKRYNVLVVSADSRTFTLYANDFKTLRSHGPSKLEIEESMWIVPYLKQYNAGREVLLCGKTHPYMHACHCDRPSICLVFLRKVSGQYVWKRSKYSRWNDEATSCGCDAYHVVAWVGKS